MILYLFFFFNDTATTEIYTLSLHDALPILRQVVELHLARIHGQPEDGGPEGALGGRLDVPAGGGGAPLLDQDRKSTRLNSSHANISYAVFCLKKKKKHTIIDSLCMTTVTIL